MTLTKIINSIKSYFHKLADIQNEAIKFNKELERYWEGK
jgi:hypothetical protein